MNVESLIGMARWEPDEDGGWVADLGVLHLSIDGDHEDGHTWMVSWRGDYVCGACNSFEDGKRKAADCAAKLTLELATMVNVMVTR